MTQWGDPLLTLFITIRKQNVFLLLNMGNLHPVCLREGLSGSSVRWVVLFNPIQHGQVSLRYLLQIDKKYFLYPSFLIDNRSVKSYLISLCINRRGASEVECAR